MAKNEIFLADYQVPEYLIETTNLTFNLKNEDKSYVKAVYKVVKNPKSTAANNFILKADEIEVTQLRLNDNILTPKEYSFDGKTFVLENAPDEFMFEVNNTIDPANNSHLMGLYKSNGMFCSQCEAEGFRRITLHPDRPDVMSVFTTTIIADKKTCPIMLSNGNKIHEEELEDGLHMVTWNDPFIKPAHLFAIVAGDLDYISDKFKTMSGKIVDLKVFTDKKNINKAGFAMHSLKKAMLWDEETFGREYDLDNFMIVAVDAFNMGAMENKGLNIFNSSAVLSSPKTSTDDQLEFIQAVVGHEYFHNWSGNRVNCRDWFQLSLKEGFTVFRDSEFSKDMTQGSRKRIADAKIMKALQFAEDSSPMAHAVQPQSYQEIDNFYTLTVYEKGSEIVRMYKTLLGKQGFRKGTDLYFDTFDGQAVTIEDFRNSMEKANDVDLSQFHNWYTQEGTPVLKIEEKYNKKSQTLTLNFKQVIKAGQKPFYIPVKYGLVDKNGNDINQNNMLIVSQMEQSFEFYDLAEKPVLSLLRNFSAPVILDYKQDDEEILFLAKNDNDNYNRYEAIARILIKTIQQAADDLKQGKEIAVSKDIIDLYCNTINDETIELPMIASYLEMPAISTLEEQTQPIEPILLRKAHKEVGKIISIELEDEFSKMFNKYYNNKPYEFNALEINNRAIAMQCLAFLFKANEDEYLEKVQELFNTTDNMTIEATCFSLLLSSDNKVVRDSAIESFYGKWHADNLVLNKWFANQAANKKVCDIEFLAKLMEHEKFDIKEPNKVRSVVGSFTANENFHSKEGYKAYADLIIKLDSINPHMAAGLVRKLMSFKKYAQPYQNLMLETLNYINSNVKSAGVKEILTKTLA
jgi:aminopeptidase N